MSLPKVSILIPIYNVSSYIERCAHSIFNQTFDDIEYIFIDDATPDDSIEKLLKVAEQYPNRKNSIKIITHERNEGIGTSRKTAVNNSSGEYVLMVDADDYIDAEMVEILFNKAVEEQADIVVCDILEYPNNKIQTAHKFISSDKSENIKNILDINKASMPLFNKLIKRNLYLKRDCQFINNFNYAEDWHVMIRMFFYADKIIKIEQGLYHYNCNNEYSITRTVTKRHFDNTIFFMEELEKFLMEKNLFEKYYSIIEKNKAHMKMNLMFGVNSIKLRKEYAGMFRKEEEKYFHEYRLGEKIMSLLLKNKLFFLTQMLRNLILLKNR